MKMVIREEKGMATWKLNNPHCKVPWPTRQQLFDLIYAKENRPLLAFFVIALEDEKSETHRHYHILIRLKEKAKRTIDQANGLIRLGKNIYFNFILIS